MYLNSPIVIDENLILIRGELNEKFSIIKIRTYYIFLEYSKDSGK